VDDGYTIYCSDQTEGETGGQIVQLEGKRKAYNIVVGKPEGTSSLGGPKRRSDNNIKMKVK